MKVIAPELITIPSGPVMLGAPVCPVEFSLKHRWIGPRCIQLGEFSIAKHATTRAEYKLFLDETGHDVPVDWDDAALKQARQPVCGVSAEDTDAYVRWLSEKTGKPYRLPRADEWEKAARGSFEGKKFPWGDEDPTGRCSFGLTEASGPSPVGSCAANGYGLYDMVGNIWQWLADLYVAIATDEPINTPTGKPAALNRVLVGGSFMTSNPDSLWVAYRHEDPPDLRHRCLGFRVALG